MMVYVNFYLKNTFHCDIILALLGDFLKTRN